MKLRFSWKGCLIGCGSVVLLCVVFFIGSLVWLTKKGTFAPEGTVLVPESTFFVRADLRPEDPLLIEFFTTQAVQLGELDPLYSQFPEFFRDWKAGRTRKNFEKMLPVKVEVTGRDAAEGEDFRATVGFSVYNNMAKVGFWFVRRGAAKHGNLRHYQDVPYIAVEERETLYFTLRDSIVYFANQETGMQEMIAGMAAADHRRDPRLAGVDLAAPIYGFLTGDALQAPLYDGLEELERDGQTTPEATAQLRTLSDQVTRIGMDLHMVDGQTLGGTVVIDMPTGPGVDAQLQQALEAAVADSDLRFGFETRERAGGYAVAYTITGFREVAEQLKTHLEEQTR